MKIIFHKDFVKAYKRLSPNVQKAVDKRIELFEIDTYDEILQNHQLAGRYKACRSINITGDYRAIYSIIKIEDDVAYFLNVGTHSQLYT